MKLVDVLIKQMYVSLRK